MFCLPGGPDKPDGRKTTLSYFTWKDSPIQVMLLDIYPVFVTTISYLNASFYVHLSITQMAKVTEVEIMRMTSQG